MLTRLSNISVNKEITTILHKNYLGISLQQIIKIIPLCLDKQSQVQNQSNLTEFFHQYTVINLLNVLHLDQKVMSRPPTTKHLSLVPTRAI